MIKEFSTYINESNNYKVGDIAYYYGLEPKLRGERVKIISTNLSGLGGEHIVIFLDRKENKRQVDSIRLKRNKKESIKSDIDPYGEEDWDNVDESLNESNDFKVGDVVYYYGATKALHGKEVVILKLFNDYDNDYTIEFLDGGKKLCVVPSKLLKKKKEIKRVYSEDDPYGEEEWDDVDESLNEYNKFGTKGINVILTLHKILIGVEKIFSIVPGLMPGDDIMKGVYTKYKSLKLFYNFLNRKDIRDQLEYAKNNRKNVDEIIDYIKEEYEKFRPGHDFFNDLNAHIDYFWTYFFLSNKGESKLRDIKNSLPIGFKITSEDPYGEEDWSDIDESLNESNDFKVGDIVLYFGDEISRHGEKMIVIKKGQGGHYITKFTSDMDTKYMSEDKLKAHQVKRIYTQDDPYGEEDWNNEKWNIFKRQPKAVKIPGRHAQVDPYGEEDWDEPVELINKFYKLELGNGKWDRIYFKVKDNEYLLVIYKITYPSGGEKYIIVSSFESGFSKYGGGNYEYLQKGLTDQLIPVNDYEYNKIKIELEEPNSYLKASSERVISNIELLKRRFIN